MFLAVGHVPSTLACRRSLPVDVETKDKPHFSKSTEVRFSAVLKEEINERTEGNFSNFYQILLLHTQKNSRLLDLQYDLPPNSKLTTLLAPNTFIPPHKNP